jgi:hypothetical protein
MESVMDRGKVCLGEYVSFVRPHPKSLSLGERDFDATGRGMAYLTPTKRVYLGRKDVIHKIFYVLRKPKKLHSGQY